MIFKEVKLRKDSWHYRLQRKMFGPLPTYNNFCPYFWITVFCVITSPLFFLLAGIVAGVKRIPSLLSWLGVVLAPVGRVLEWGIELLLKGLEKGVDAAICMPLERMDVGNLSDGQVVELYQHSAQRWIDRYGYDKDYATRALLGEAEGKRQRTLWARMDAKFSRWMEQAGEDWRKKLDEAVERERARYKQEEEERSARERLRQQAAAEAEAKRKQRLNAIVKWTKVIVPVALAILALIPLYGLYKLALLVAALPWANFFICIGNLLRGIPGAILWLLMLPVRGLRLFWGWELAVMTVTVLAGVIALRKAPKCTLFLTRRREPPRWMIAILDRIEACVLAIASFFAFMRDGFLMWKRDNCPQIIWED